MMAALIAAIIAYGVYKRTPVFDEFLAGAAQGLRTIAKILPSLLGLLFAIEIFKASGALDLLTFAIGPLLSRLGVPKEVVPLALLRPVSGSGSLAIVADIFKDAGPDSFAGRCASVMMGSTETTFYTIAVYFGAARIKKIAYTPIAALFGDLLGFAASIIIVTLFFGK
ncbi:MAG: spore maturation protein [Clostridia bacterium]|nr:spore maturation protein [Clostridia bacterium]